MSLKIIKQKSKKPMYVENWAISCSPLGSNPQEIHASHRKFRLNVPLKKKKKLYWIPDSISARFLACLI